MILNRNPSALGRRGHDTALDRGRPERVRGTATGWLLGLRGDRGFTAATGVWVDQSGSGNTTSPQSATRPSASTFNGKASVLWPNGVGQALLTPSMSLGLFSIGMTFKDSAAGYVCVHATDAGTDGGYFYTDTTTTNGYARGSVLSDKKYTAGLKDSVARSAVWTFGGTTATNLLYLNGALASETTNTGNDPGAGPTAGAMYLAGSQASTGQSPLNLQSFDVFAHVLSVSEMAKYTNYARALGGV